MKALIFAAGLGTRLRPITDRLPKALVEVGGMPMLERAIRNIKAAGIQDIIVNIHHFPDQIRKFLDDNDFGCNITISDESDKLLDTGGAVAKVVDRFGSDEPILLYNADIATDLDLSSMIRRYEELKPDALLLVSDRPTSRYLLFDESGKMHGWLNEKTGEIKPEGLNPEGLIRKAFGGIHILGSVGLKASVLYRKAFNLDVFSITDQYIQSCHLLDIHAYESPTPYRWHDIGSPEKLKAARAAFS